MTGVHDLILMACSPTLVQRFLKFYSWKTRLDTNKVIFHNKDNYVGKSVVCFGAV